jgi:hypothetical protein
LKGIRDLIALFAAFFVAALAAVATFARPSLDEYMAGTTPQLGRRKLTRRQFVCYLFGYLAVLAFSLFLAIVAAEIVAPSLRRGIPPGALWWLQAGLGTLFVLAFWNMVVTTLLGIYFLVARIHLEPVRTEEPPTPQGADNRPNNRRAA